MIKHSDFPPFELTLEAAADSGFAFEKETLITSSCLWEGQEEEEEED